MNTSQARRLAALEAAVRCPRCSGETSVSQFPEWLVVLQALHAHPDALAAVKQALLDYSS